MSEFRIAILRPDGERVWLVPGRKGTLTEPGEHDLIQACPDAIVAKGVGLFRTEAQVRLAIEQGITEVLMAMKTAVLPKPK